MYYKKQNSMHFASIETIQKWQKAKKHIRVSDLIFDEKMYLPGLTYSDSSAEIKFTEQLQAYQKLFINRWGNLLLTRQNGTYAALYSSNFKKWQRAGIAGKSESMKYY